LFFALWAPADTHALTMGSPASLREILSEPDWDPPASSLRSLRL